MTYLFELLPFLSGLGYGLLAFRSPVLARLKNIAFPSMILGIAFTFNSGELFGPSLLATLECIVIDSTLVAIGCVGMLLTLPRVKEGEYASKEN